MKLGLEIRVFRIKNIATIFYVRYFAKHYQNLKELTYHFRPQNLANLAIY